MAAQLSTSAAVAAADDTWSKLPADLLGEVYGRIVSPLDRVRFTVVCRSWRVVKSRQQPAPTLPWLIFSSYHGGAMRVFCPMDGVSLRLQLPPEAVHNRLVGFHDGGWIAAASSRDGGAGDWLTIVNLYSGVEAPLSAKQRATPYMDKLVCSERPTSNRCIIAVTTAGLAVCKVGCRNHNWWRSRERNHYYDIAFYDGKLCGLLRRSLQIYTISMTKNSDLVVSITYELDMNQLPKCVGSDDVSYIFKHGDRMLMAKRAQWTTVQNRLFFKDPVNRTRVCVGSAVSLDHGVVLCCYWRVGAEACGGGGGTRDTVVVAARMP
ncbi:uncharacterized protein [Aegilops tauschii subsp. strangulata]|uniref:uncharacterized protein n=1 Tax=Aegilops tauschii subsp. strangulata TaxID=200361 RepID=UPI00098BC3A6|nr:uncharacterized protein LOC109768484 [Aegilops tauschii subsp. strangulata]